MTDGNTSHSSSSARQQQFDEILAELMRAIDAGESVDSVEWVTSHPEFAEELKEFFAKHERVEKLARPLRQAAANALHVRCPHCHNPIELLEQAPLSDISCPSCGSSFSLIGENTLSRNARTKSFGHFELLDRVGIGQFGSVWKSRDTKLERIVAIKIPRNGRMDSAQTEMFLRDARAAAQLKHPNIVSVHEVGKQDDTVYIVSDFIQGATLREWTAAKPLTPREAAKLCVKIAKALHHAHEAGVIHRDLKPGNIMMDTEGEPHIVDFGLAKREAGEITMTIEGQILGTPAYMSPEQARGESHTVDRRADVYSLGVIVFELLTGDLPFRGDKQMLIVQILNDDPPNPRKLNGTVPRDLATICYKCLSKEPAKRYLSADALADDLQRFIEERPINARPVGRFSRGWRWCRRRPASAALLGTASTLALTLALGGTIVAWRERQHAKHYQLVAADEKRARVEAEQWASENEQLALRERQAKREAKLQLDHSEWLRYSNHLELAQSEADAGNISASWRHLDACRWDFRGWEHDYLYTRFSKLPVLGRHGGTVLCVAYSVDGERVVSGSSDGTITIWNSRSRAEPVTFDAHLNGVRSVAFSPDGLEIISGGDDQLVKVWDVRNAEFVPYFRPNYEFAGHSGPVTSVAYCLDDWQIISGSSDGTVKLWDMVEESEVATFSGHTQGILCVALSPDGKHILSGGLDGTMRLWDVPTSQLIMTLSEHAGPITSVAFSPNGRGMVSGSRDKTVRIWDTTTGEQVVNLEGHTGFVTSVAYSPNGERIVSASEDRSVRIWDVSTGENTFSITKHTGMVTSVEFSPDGQRVVGGSDDNTVAIWKATPHGKDSSIGEHIQVLSVSPDGQQIVSQGAAGTLNVWDAQSGERISTLEGHGSPVTCVAFSRAGERIVIGNSDKTLTVWDTRSGQELLTLAGHTDGFRCVAFSPNGQQIVGGSWDSAVRVWDAHSGNEMLTLTGHALGVSCVAFSPDGDRVVSGGRDAKLKVWDAHSGQPLLTLKGHRGWLDSVAVSPDGKRIVSGARDRMVKVWNAMTGEEIQSLAGHSRGVSGVAFSPDGRRILSVGFDKTMRLWDSNTGHATLTLTSDFGFRSVAFIPNGQQIVAIVNNKLRRYDASTNQEPLTIRVGLNNLPKSVAFSLDGKRIVSAGGLAIDLWDTITGQRTSALSGFTAEITSVAWSPNGEQIVSGGLHGVRLWDIQEKTVSLVWRKRGGFSSVAFSSDGQRIVCGTRNRDGIIEVLDVESGRTTLTLVGHSAEVTSVAFGPGGRRIISGGKDNTLKVWDAQSGEEMLTLQGHTSPLTCVALSPDGRRIVSGSWDKTLKVWDAQSGEEMLTLQGHTSPVTCVALSPDGRRIVSGSRDMTLKIWETNSGRELSTLLGHTRMVVSVAFSSDGQRIVSGSLDATMKVWEVGPEF